MTSAIDDPVNAAAKHLNIEVDQQAQPKAGQLQIREYLRAVNRQHLTHGLHFNDDGPFYYQIQPVPTIQLNTTIVYR